MDRRRRADPAVLRDYFKSVKHHWSEAAYIPDVADSASAWRVASLVLFVSSGIWDLGSGPNFVKVLAAFSCVR
jgi:hypothetical protein